MAKRFAAALFLMLLCTASIVSAQKKIPAVRFLDTDKVPISNKDIPAGKSLMLVYFRSDCDHCIHTAQMLKEQAQKYPAIIWMVSAETIDALRMFEDMSGLYDVDNVTVLQDNQQKMHTWFDFSKLPYIVLFDKNGKQLKTYDELPSVESVKKILMGK